MLLLVSSSPLNYLTKVSLFVAVSYNTRILAKLLTGSYRQRNKECTWVIQMSEQSQKEMKTAVKVNVRLFKDNVNYWFFWGDYLFKGWQACLQIETRQPRWMGERGRRGNWEDRDFPGEENEPFMKPLGLKRWLNSFRVHPSPCLFQETKGKEALMSNKEISSKVLVSLCFPMKNELSSTPSDLLSKWQSSLEFLILLPAEMLIAHSHTLE